MQRNGPTIFLLIYLQTNMQAAETDVIQSDQGVEHCANCSDAIASYIATAD